MKKNLDLPKEGDVVVVTGKLEGNMKDRLNGLDRVGTCVIIKKGAVAVLFENGDVWWGRSYEVFIHEKTPVGLQPTT